MPLLLALSLLATSELSIQTGITEELLLILHDGQELSRNYSGNQSFDICVDQEKSANVLFIEQWESK